MRLALATRPSERSEASRAFEPGLWSGSDLAALGSIPLPWRACGVDAAGFEPVEEVNYARVGSAATRTNIFPKFPPRSISAKAVGMSSNPSRMSSR
jgi:hypothetical protein